MAEPVLPRLPRLKLVETDDAAICDPETGLCVLPADDSSPADVPAGEAHRSEERSPQQDEAQRPGATTP